MGGYDTVDKTKERAKITKFLEQKKSVCFDNVKEKPLPKKSLNLKFDKHGKLVK